MNRKYRTKSGVITTWHNSLGRLAHLDDYTGDILETWEFDPANEDATFCIDGETIRIEVLSSTPSTQWSSD